MLITGTARVDLDLRYVTNLADYNRGARRGVAAAVRRVTSEIIENDAWDGAPIVLELWKRDSPFNNAAAFEVIATTEVQIGGRFGGEPEQAALEAGRQAIEP